MGLMSYWRDTARPIIAKVLKETKGKTEAEIKKALQEAYPFGLRQYHPYKIWCDEIRRQRGKKIDRKDRNTERMF
jgi:hypothetical protein